jgi:hypothetical protein
MKQERVILSFIMVLIGLAFAGIIFYFYQSSKVIPQANNKTADNPTPTPTSTPTLFLTLDDPRDESISEKKTIRVAGKTNPNATVVILTLEGQEIVKPSLQGDFVTQISIDDGTNYIRVQALAPNGETQTIQRIVSYTTEDF